MPMTVKVGLAKKVGQPDFGSLGASCDIELELDGGLLFNDLEGLQHKIQTAYVACRQAVNDELAGQRRTIEPTFAEAAAGNNGHGQPASNGHHHRIPAENGQNPTNGRSQVTKGKYRAATTSQVRALHAIATRQGFNLTERLREQFSLYRAEELSISEASRLIDELNQSSTPVGANGYGGHA
jgi:hypothetical protein